MTNCELCGPELRLGMGLLFPGKQVAPVGKPLPQEIDTLPGNPLLALGVTVAVKVAGTPAGTVDETGAAFRLKSFTMTLAPDVACCDWPTKAAPLFPKTVELPEITGAVAVKTTVTVAVAPAFNVPTLHNTT